MNSFRFLSRIRYINHYHMSNLIYLLIKRQLIINQTSMTHTKMCTVRRQTTKIRTIDLSVKIWLGKSKEVLGQDVEFRKLRRNIMLLSLLMSGYSSSTVNMRAREKKGNARIRRCP